MFFNLVFLVNFLFMLVSNSLFFFFLALFLPLSYSSFVSSSVCFSLLSCLVISLFFIFFVQIFCFFFSFCLNVLNQLFWLEKARSCLLACLLVHSKEDFLSHHFTYKGPPSVGSFHLLSFYHVFFFFFCLFVHPRSHFLKKLLHLIKN